MQGKFISFEGAEAAGKSTQIKLLGEYLQYKNIPYLITREPGGGKMSEQIREMLLNEKNQFHALETEALLIAAARVEHIKEIVLPALKEGKVVLCDRYLHSTYAYQGYGRGLPLDFLKTINDIAIKTCMPERTIFLDIPPIDAFTRKRANLVDRIEKEGNAFHERVYRGYQLLLQEDATMVRIDARDSIEAIHRAIVQVLKI